MLVVLPFNILQCPGLSATIGCVILGFANNVITTASMNLVRERGDGLFFFKYKHGERLLMDDA